MHNIKINLQKPAVFWCLNFFKRFGGVTYLMPYDGGVKGQREKEMREGEKSTPFWNLLEHVMSLIWGILYYPFVRRNIVASGSNFSKYQALGVNLCRAATWCTKTVCIKVTPGRSAFLRQTQLRRVQRFLSINNCKRCSWRCLLRLWLLHWM